MSISFSNSVTSFLEKAKKFSKWLVTEDDPYFLSFLKEFWSQIDKEAAKHKIESKLIKDFFNKPFFFLFEAACCYQDGSYDATVLMCRAAVSSSLILAVTRTQHEKFRGAYGFDREVEKELRENGYRWKTLSEIAEHKEILTKKELDDVYQNVLDRGHHIAHFAEREDRISNEQMRKLIAITPKDAKGRPIKSKHMPFPKDLLPPQFARGVRESTTSKEVAYSALSKSREYMVNIGVNHFLYSYNYEKAIKKISRMLKTKAGQKKLRQLVKNFKKESILPSKKNIKEGKRIKIYPKVMAKRGRGT